MYEKRITEKEIEQIKRACEDAIYRRGDPISNSLALLPDVLGSFPLRLFKLCPELETVYKKLKKGEVKL